MDRGGGLAAAAAAAGLYKGWDSSLATTVVKDVLDGIINKGW